MRFLIPVFVLALAGCANLSLNDVYQNPTFNYQSTSIRSVSFSELAGTSTVQISNSNPYNLPISSLGAELWLEGSPWVSLTNDSISGIPGSGSVNVDFNWGLVFAELIERANTVYQNGEADFTIKLAPTITVPVLGVQTVQWTSKFKVPVPKLPSVKVSDWNVSSVSLTSVKLALDLEVENPNVFSIDTRDWEMGVKKDNRSLVDLKLLDSSVSARGKSTQQVEMKLSLVDAGLAIISSLKAGRWPESFALDWNGKWQSPELDFDLPALAGNLSAPL